jgi:hypothetical protein
MGLPSSLIDHRRNKMRRSEDEKQTLSPDRSFHWPIDVTRYDRTPELSSAEREALKLFVKPPRDRAIVVERACQQGHFARLPGQLQDALAVVEGEERLTALEELIHLHVDKHLSPKPPEQRARQEPARV